MWAVYAVGFGAPALAFLGALIGHLLGRRASTELDIWRRREETMRMLRWASEQATSEEDAKARMGLAVLDALSESELLQAPDQALVDAVIDAVLEEPIEEIEGAGTDVEVVEVDSDFVD
jgi:ribosome assembly protein YihI (activator of Der GTPase)